METFQEFYEELLSEDFGIIPGNLKDIEKLDPKYKDDLADLYDTVQDQTNSRMVDPLAIDRKVHRKVKIARGVADDVNLPSVKKKFPKLNISVGNGSRGNQGSANRGNLFEGELADDLRTWIAEGLDGEFMYPQFIDDFAEKELTGAKNIEVQDMGALNQPRPIVFKGKKIYIGSDNFDVGPTVTDVTVVADGKPYYLSLKMGGTVTFFNAGVRKLFPDSSFKNGEVETKEGKALLDMLAIDHDRFIKIFTEYVKPAKKTKAEKDVVDVTNKIDKKVLHDFIKSGVGAGYWLIHKVKKHVYVENISTTKLASMTKPQSVKIHYPKGGGAKRIDIVIETPKFQLKFNIRNKQGGLNPTHIMSDYKILH
jgi:hypothetical protein